MAAKIMNENIHPTFPDIVTIATPRECNKADQIVKYAKKCT